MNTNSWNDDYSACITTEFITDNLLWLNNDICFITLNFTKTMKPTVHSVNKFHAFYEHKRQLPRSKKACHQPLCRDKSSAQTPILFPQDSFSYYTPIVHTLSKRALPFRLSNKNFVCIAHLSPCVLHVLSS